MGMTLQRFLDYIFPRYCCFCGEHLRQSNFRYLCDACAARLIPIREPICKRCGHPLTFDASCPRCARYTFDFEQLRSAFPITRYSRQLIHNLKYKNQTHLASDLARLMLCNPLMKDFLQGSILVPVPLHWRRHFWREYNQSELLARALAAIESSISIKLLLKKTRHTHPQVGLHSQARQQNVKGSFRLNTKIHVDRQVKVIVLDDVLTTGATINECCQTLKQNGFQHVYAATFAQTVRFKNSSLY
ncbi:MAG: ComF family protein [Verrucomicrobiota bacterium]|nr:MAG: ComF family protein [Verrucomicrobiota bacterium]